MAFMFPYHFIVIALTQDHRKESAVALYFEEDKKHNLSKNIWQTIMQ